MTGLVWFDSFNEFIILFHYAVQMDELLSTHVLTPAKVDET